MFPLPGAPRQAPMDPTRLHAFMTQPSSVATASALKPTNSRQSKRLLVGNLPDNPNEESLLQFFNELLTSLNVTIGSPDPVTMVQLNVDKTLAMIEFKNTNDTTVCLAFSGLEFEGRKLEIRRPKDYIVPLVADDATVQEPGQISSNVPDTPNKILVSKIPDYLQDEQVIELLKSFGELKAFVLVKEATDDVSKVLTSHTNGNPLTYPSILMFSRSFVLKKLLQVKGILRIGYSVLTKLPESFPRAE